MKHCFAFSLFVLIAAGVGQTEHAPTVAQCQADERLWRSQLHDDAASLRYEALRGRAAEMIACYEVDPANRQDYQDTTTMAAATMATRMSDFIRRHQLWDQFIAEDAAGKR